MNPQIIFEILAKNRDDLLAIEQAVGGLSGILKLEPQAYAIYEAYEAGGADQVLRTCGPHVQVVVETIGPANIAAVMPRVANILKTLQAK